MKRAPDTGSDLGLDAQQAQVPARSGAECVESRSGLSGAGRWGADPQAKIVKHSECPAVLVEWRSGPILSRELKHRILTLLFGEPGEHSQEDEVSEETQRNA